MDSVSRAGAALLTFGLVLTSACSSASSRGATLVLAQRVDHIDVVGREPMVVEHPNGTLFVAGYGEPRPFGRAPITARRGDA